MIVEGQPDGADRARPRPTCDVGDRIFFGQIVGLAQPSAEDEEQTQRFAPIAVDRIGLPLGCIADEMMHLSLQRAEARHLPNQPLLYLTAPSRLGRQKLSALFGQIETDRTVTDNR